MSEAELTRKTVLSGKSAQVRRSERLPKKKDLLEPTVKEEPASDVIELTDEESLAGEQASPDNLLSTDRRKGKRAAPVEEKQSDDGIDKQSVIELTDGSSAGEHASQDTLPSVSFLLESHRKQIALGEGKSNDDVIELTDESSVGDPASQPSIDWPTVFKRKRTVQELDGSGNGQAEEKPILVSGQEDSSSQKSKRTSCGMCDAPRLPDAFIAKGARVKNASRDDEFVQHVGILAFYR
ncbi:hypothetical protein AGABI1DRAFT_95724 [Agaricus bisporus var. burnettii JB137-S8]|uniref:Uncharacterized protein n=1 Tax=Agaricus bisporus var. burnettii (strain JB137-S8 / ATCC MYA-4627 / FGSC 10392) TaxID=597362 RepID=K5XIN3_AGABU|nr:uncharacterized protein AGABI1DRAFT_95724 [Agaricus bisporus var. burnettii JB137-S8]EKM74310.1 hypothetical protein AGABI1DRAFT_95724 [Agaricus bisporus var. burnettii JB137-S8]